MLAIPLDTKTSTVISELYGKAPYFALLDIDTGDFRVVENEVKGAGPKSAKFLKTKGADSTIYYHMGDGVYKSFAKEDIGVYSANYKHMTLDEIYLEFYEQHSHIEVNSTNYKELLDPGNGESCQCGCSN